MSDEQVWSTEETAKKSKEFTEEAQKHGFDMMIVYLPIDEKNADGGSVFANKRPWTHLAATVSQSLVGWGAWMEQQRINQLEKVIPEEPGDASK